MSGESPDVVLYDSNGNQLSVQPNSAIPASTPLILTGGSDGANARYHSVDSSGRLNVNGIGNFTVIQPTAANLNATVVGTITANVGTTNGLALDSSINGILLSQGSTTSGEKGVLIQAAVSTAAPSYTTAQTSPLSLTLTGALRVDGSAATQPISGTITANQGTSPWVSNITQFGSANIATGTGASGAGIPRITVSNDSNILTTQSGTWTVQPGNTANTTPWLTTINQGSNSAVVKAASTAAVAADAALVVTISPNSAALQTTATTSGAVTGVAFGFVAYGATAGVLTAVRATAYTEQTTNFTGSIKSSSANDTSAGTGARSVIITYYDQTGAGPLTETATLNGTTAVNLTNTNHCFIEKIVVATNGSLGGNAGTISLFTGSGGTGTTVGSIGFANITSVGDNTTLWAHHYTPLGKTTSYYLVNFGTTGNQGASASLHAGTPLIANSTESQISDFLIVGANSNSVSRTLVSPLKITGFARTTCYVVSNGTHTNYFAGFDYSDQ